MTKIQKIIENTIYGYDPQEYMPIRIDGELANKGAFIAYKIRRAGQHVIRIVDLATR